MTLYFTQICKYDGGFKPCMWLPLLQALKFSNTGYIFPFINITLAFKSLSNLVATLEISYFTLSCYRKTCQRFSSAKII